MVSASKKKSWGRIARSSPSMYYPTDTTTYLPGGVLVEIGLLLIISLLPIIILLVFEVLPSEAPRLPGRWCVNLPGAIPAVRVPEFLGREQVQFWTALTAEGLRALRPKR